MGEDIVERLRKQAGSRSGEAHLMSDGSIRWFPMLDEAADEIERLRAELAAANARIMELERIVEVHRDTEIRANNFRREADMMHDEYKTIRAERDELRAIIASELPYEAYYQECERENDRLRAELATAKLAAEANIIRATNDEIEMLREAFTGARVAAIRIERLLAERDALRALLREARQMLRLHTLFVVREDLCARIDAALKGDGDE